MKPRVPGPSACAALESVAEAASHFAGAESDEIMRAAPPLVLRALPAVCCVELSMRFADRIGPSVSRAEGWRHRSHPPEGGGLGSTLPMDIRTQDGWARGRLLLTSRSEEGLLGVAALTAELMAVHIEQALELAHLREVNGGMRLALAHARDIGMVIGLSWAGTAEAQTAASCLLDKLEQQAVTEPRALHERDDYRFCATPGARLRVVPGDRRGR